MIKLSVTIIFSLVLLLHSYHILAHDIPFDNNNRRLIARDATIEDDNTISLPTSIVIDPSVTTTSLNLNDDESSSSGKLLSFSTSSINGAGFGPAIKFSDNDVVLYRIGIGSKFGVGLVLAVVAVLLLV